MDGPGGSATPPICVLGASRTGTSLAMRVIGLLGVNLGPEERMLPTVTHDNAKGYWEQAAVMELNDEILSALGGGLYDPPALEPGWEQDTELDPFVARVRELVAAHFTADRRWGWKDPRTSLTLPLWRRAIGEMAYVVCLRNPLEAAASDTRRNPEAYPLELTLPLVLHFSASALRNTAGRRRLLLFYEDWFEDPQRQLEKLGAFVLGGSERPAGWEEAALSFFEGSLRRNHVREDEMARDARIEPEIRAFYIALRAAQGAPLSAALESLLPELDDAFRVRMAQANDVAELEAAVAKRDREAAALRSSLERAESRASEAEAALAAHQESMAAVYSSLSWRVTAPLRAVKRSLKRTQ